MDNKEFSKLLEKRTRDFAVRIIKLSTALPNTPEGRSLPLSTFWEKEA
jgi:hypothetical protein